MAASARVNRAIRSRAKARERHVSQALARGESDWEALYQGSRADLMWTPASAFTMMHIRKLFKLIATRGDCAAFLELFGADRHGSLPEMDNLSERGAEALLRVADLYFRGDT